MDNFPSSVLRANVIKKLSLLDQIKNICILRTTTTTTTASQTNQVSPLYAMICLLPKNFSLPTFFFFQHGITPKAQPPGFMGFLETNTEHCLKMPKSQMYGRQKDRFILLDDNGADIYPGASVTPNQILASTILYQLCNQLPSQEQSIPVVAALSTGAIN